MPKCKLKNGQIYSFTQEAYDSIISSGMYIEKVEDDKKPDVLKDKTLEKGKE